ncbi:ammonium transporter, partial [Trifolium medium]|nr:ammonium transporter [Trifolium medium]
RILTWEIAQGLQNTPESSLQYANDNALLLAKSLRGTLLALFYGSTLLSALTSGGLVLLGAYLVVRLMNLVRPGTFCLNIINRMNVYVSEHLETLSLLAASMSCHES